VYKLPLASSREDRARVQILGAAFVAFSQGIAYFHAGSDMLRSKSMDRDSFDSGDWFNRLDWSLIDNGFAAGLPPRGNNGAEWPIIAPLLANSALKPTPVEIAWTYASFRDLLRIRASSTLFRLRSSADVKERLHFYNTGVDQEPTVIAGHLDGAGYPGAGFGELLYLINVDRVAHTLAIPELAGKEFVLHPVQRAPDAADPRPADARTEAASGRFEVPARTALVYVRD
jgi:pullulanase